MGGLSKNTSLPPPAISSETYFCGTQFFDNLLTPTSLMAIANETLKSLVRWAQQQPQFCTFSIQDQMKLLHISWPNLFVLDFVQRQITSDGTCIVLINGETIPYVEVPQALYPVGRKVLLKCLNLAKKLQQINFDEFEGNCFKMLLLFDTVSAVESCDVFSGNTKQVLRDYTLRNKSTHLNRFGILLNHLLEAKSIGSLFADFLNCRFNLGKLPMDSLLVEMIKSRQNIFPKQICHSPQNCSSLSSCYFDSCSHSFVF